MGKREQEELLQAMSLVAREEDHKHLSKAGSEELEMMEYATSNSGISITEACVEAPAPPLTSQSASRTSSRLIWRVGR